MVAEHSILSLPKDPETCFIHSYADFQVDLLSCPRKLSTIFVGIIYEYLKLHYKYKGDFKHSLFMLN